MSTFGPSTGLVVRVILKTGSHLKKTSKMFFGLTGFQRYAHNCFFQSVNFPSFRGRISVVKHHFLRYIYTVVIRPFSGDRSNSPLCCISHRLTLTKYLIKIEKKCWAQTGDFLDTRSAGGQGEATEVKRRFIFPNLKLK